MSESAAPCPSCMNVPESGGKCEKCGATWAPDERGTLQLASSAAQGQEDEWNITYEHVDPQDPLIAWPRWREALRELTKPKYGVATMTVARKALGDE